MKKINLLLIFLTLLEVKSVDAQWTLLNPGSIAELRSAYFFNSQEGLVVGSDTVMLKTDNGGLSWSTVSSNADTLRCIFFTDDTTGYAVGAKGKIMKSIDKGNTWAPQVSGDNSLLRSVHFPTHDTGYVAGGNGTILKTTDGGVNWIPQASGTTQDLISIRFTSADTGYTVSSLPTFFGGLILKTVNGGTNWDTVYTNVNGFLSVFPVNSDTVYAVGGAGTIVKSVDGGANWITQVTGDTNRLRASFFLTADTGYVAGELGTLFFTGDGGNTWTNQSTQLVGLLGLYFPISDTGYVVGNAGTILRYSKPCPFAAEPAQIFGGTTVCEGDTVSYYITPVANATSYTWGTPPGASVIGGQGDTLVTITFAIPSGNVSVTSNNICGSSAPHLLTINVNPLPPTPVISISGMALVTVAANAWQWYLNGNIIAGADTSFYIPVQNGTYTVMITSAFGCNAMSAPFPVVNAGISQLDDERPVIAPVPFGDYFIISLEKALSGKMVIYTVEGRILKEVAIKAGDKTYVNARSMTPGIYFYAIVNNNDKIIYRGKMVKE